jgi:hypothetical protein
VKSLERGGNPPGPESGEWREGKERKEGGHEINIRLSGVVRPSITRHRHNWPQLKRRQTSPAVVGPGREEGLTKPDATWCPPFSYSAVEIDYND